MWLTGLCKGEMAGLGCAARQCSAPVQTAVHTQRAVLLEIVKVNVLIRSAVTGRQTARRKVRVVGRL